MAKNILLIYNPFSGFFIGMNSVEILDYLNSVTADLSGYNLRLLPFSRNKTDWIKADLKKATDAVWVIGGDGTITTIADMLMTSKIPMGILPGGTMNLLARDLGMNLDLKRAVGQLRHAVPERIDVATVNGRLFLNICNIGISTNLTERREKLRHYSKWTRWPKLVWYMINSVFVYPAMTVEFNINGQRYRFRTRSVSVSNNLLSDNSVVVPKRDRLTSGTMGVYVAKDTSLWSLPRILLKLLVGKWHYDTDLQNFSSPGFTISRRRRRRMRVMIDGELYRLQKTLRFKIRPGALSILKPGKPL
ncbi:MAG: hypothetical protein MI862_23340 [Desulfobacterales bacterium]|nr:hypothetical protein [Desulfobacterales bacterium]